MQKCILVKSVSYAQKAKYLLAQRGITSYISKQNFSSANGCSWCVKIPGYELDRAISILEGKVKMTGDVIDV